MHAGPGTRLLTPETGALFHVPGPGPYFMAHSAGAQPVAAATAMEAHYLRPWREQGSGAWDAWLAAIEGFRASLTHVIGGTAAEICPQANVSAAFGHYLGSIPRERGRDVILMSEQSFPSLGYVAQRAEAMGFALQLLPAGSDPGDAQVWVGAIDARTAAVLVMHVHSNSGRIAPVAEIVQAAHRAGARVVVDAAQSAGIVPVTLAEWGADAGIGSCLKWLSGGPGAGWLWVPERDFAVLEPGAVGWFSHADPWEMNIRDFRYADDALRFWGGTPDIAPFVAARAGVDTILGIGIDAIRSHNAALQAAFRAALEPQRPQWKWPQGEVGGTLCIGLGDECAAIADSLAGHGARVDFRGAIMRVSFASWNSLSEVNALAALLSA